MSKKHHHYYCTACGASHSKWSGKCDDCGAWNSIIEEARSSSPFATKTILNHSQDIILSTLEGDIEPVQRLVTGIEELDRVLGGGLVAGSAILLGGDPGIGKSTLILQTAIRLGAIQSETIYISGEESVGQIKMRAQRLGLQSDKVKVAALTSLNEITNLLQQQNTYRLLIIDSIQTIYHEGIEAAPGSVSQVRACAFELIRLAKTKGFSLILIGHVTKEGNIAGPKVLEHMVDTVLYFEGEKGQQFRLLRAVKNRFGAANEIGVFKMVAQGLEEVLNPSSLFLPLTDDLVSGSCIFAGVEGSRPILLEVQALVVPSFLATPRRSVVGWDPNRLSMLVAVLNARYGISVLDKEIYLNVAGGMKIAEPAADLAVLAAIISAVLNKPIARDIVFFGEVGLSGEVRPVPNTDMRINEAAKLGFNHAVIPHNTNNSDNILAVKALKHIKDLRDIFG